MRHLSWKVFSSLKQQFTHFRKIQAPPLNSRGQKIDTKHVPNWGPRNICRHLRKHSHRAIWCPVFMHSWFRISSVYMKLESASPSSPVPSQFIPVNSCQTSCCNIRYRKKPKLSNRSLILYCPTNAFYSFLISPIPVTYGARGSAFSWGTALQFGRSRVRFPMASLEFFIDIILPAALWPSGWLIL